MEQVHLLPAATSAVAVAISVVPHTPVAAAIELVEQLVEPDVVAVVVDAVIAVPAVSVVVASRAAVGVVVAEASVVDPIAGRVGRQKRQLVVVTFHLVGFQGPFCEAFLRGLQWRLVVLLLRVFLVDQDRYDVRERGKGWSVKECFCRGVDRLGDGLRR